MHVSTLFNFYTYNKAKFEKEPKHYTKQYDFMKGHVCKHLLYAETQFLAYSLQHPYLLTSFGMSYN